MRASWRVTPALWCVGLLIPGASAQSSNSTSDPSPPVLATDAASRFVGGPDFTPGGIEVDASGNIYLAGNNRINNADGSYTYHVELYKLNPQFEVVFHLLIAGNKSDELVAMAMDPAGNIYFAGRTSSPDFPTVNPIQASLNGVADVFLTKVDSDGKIVFSTFLGGSSFEIPNVLTVDADGNAFLGGQTASTDFPSTPGAYMAEFDPGPTSLEMFLVKIATDSSTLAYSTAFGGGINDRFYGIAEVSGGDVFLLLNPSQTEFPVTDNSTNPGPRGQLVARLSPDGSQLVFASYSFSMPGIYADLLVNKDGNLILTGGNSIVVIDAATNMEISSVQAFLGAHVVEDADGNLVGSAGGSIGPASTNGYSSGRSFVVKTSPLGVTLYLTYVPYGTDGAGIAVGPDGAIYLAGTSGMVSRLFPKQSDPLMALPRIMGIANAAGRSVSPRVAPGELMSLYGPSIGSQEAATAEIGSDGLVTTALGGVEVHFNGTPGRLLYTGPLQVNVAAPFVWGQGDSVLVEVFHDGDLWSSLTVHPVDADPAVFMTGIPVYAAAYNQDQTVNSQDNPASLGSIVTIFLSGAGTMTGASYQDGEVFDPSTPLADLPTTKLPVTLLTAGGRTSTPPGNTLLEILYAGQTPASLAGVIQVNFRLPSEGPLLGPSEAFIVSVGDVRSFDPFLIWVTAADGQ